MTDNSKQIQDWQIQLKESFGETSRLYQYLFETMENFFYRYLETTQDKGLKVKELAPNTYGASSTETNMMEALKIQNPVARPGIMELAKNVPKAQHPAVRYSLIIEIKEMSAEEGHLIISSIIDWHHPDFHQPPGQAKKIVDFKYRDLGVFRKELALKLEEASQFFL
jgi:hypothetical protein